MKLSQRPLAFYWRHHIVRVRSLIGTEDFDLLTGKRSSEDRKHWFVFSYVAIYLVSFFFAEDNYRFIIVLLALALTFCLMVSHFSEGKRSKLWMNHACGKDNGIYELKSVR